MNEELIRKRKKQIGKDNLKFLSFAIILIAAIEPVSNFV